MSRLEELSNSLKARAEQIAGRIQDTEAYQKLAERYQGFNSTRSTNCNSGGYRDDCICCFIFANDVLLFI